MTDLLAPPSRAVAAEPPAVAPRDRRAPVFRAAIAVAALHAIDVAFLRPNPGTEASDHLAAGLVPAAVALAAALAYPRLAGGWRVALALACGVLAATAGVALAPAATALAGLAAGIALTGLAAVEWWLLVRRGRWGLRRVARAVALTFAGAAGALFVVAPVAFSIAGNNRAHRTVADRDLGRPYGDVTLTTSDGLDLAAWYVPSRNGAAVIVFPGRSEKTARHARVLVRHGYGVLLLDRRGEGASGGDFSARGWGGEGDLRAAVDFLARRPDVRHIGGLGLSVGGELLLQAAARDERLGAVVSEGAGQRSLREERHLTGHRGLLRWISPAVTETAANVVLTGGGPPPDLAELVRRIPPRPVLLISARDGNPDEELNRTYRDAASTATLWELGHGGHTGALSAEPAAYERRVTAFLDAALGVR